jgi:hypothetical protein
LSASDWFWGTIILVPWLVLPLAVRRSRVCKRAAVASLIVAPLVGAAIVLTAEGSWWWIILAYLDALMVAGGWSALLGALGTRALDALARHRATTPSLLLTGLLVGASVGLAFVGCLGARSAKPWLLAGALAGATSGLLCARLVTTTERPSRSLEAS